MAGRGNVYANLSLENKCKYVVAAAMEFHPIIKANGALTFKNLNFTAKHYDDARRLFEGLIRSKIPIARTHRFSVEKAIRIFGVLKNTLRTLVRGCF